MHFFFYQGCVLERINKHKVGEAYGQRIGDGGGSGGPYEVAATVIAQWSGAGNDV